MYETTPITLILFIILIAFLYFMRKRDLSLQLTKPTIYNSVPLITKKGDIIPNSLILGTHQTNTNKFQVVNGQLVVPDSPYKVTCDESKDISCRMYNHVDVNSKCSSLCQLCPQGPLLFNGNHTAIGGINTCECIPAIEHFTLDFSNINSKFQALQDPLPTDIKYNNRNVLGQHEENRFKHLIFG